MLFKYKVECELEYKSQFCSFQFTVQTVIFPVLRWHIS